MGESFIESFGKGWDQQPLHPAKVWAKCGPDTSSSRPTVASRTPLVTSQAWQRLPLPTQAGRVYFLRGSSPPFPSLPEGPRLAGTSGDHLVQGSSRETASELPRAVPRWILSISTTSADHPHSSEIIFFCLKRISRVSFGVHHLDTTPKTLAPFPYSHLFYCLGIFANRHRRQPPP